MTEGQKFIFKVGELEFEIDDLGRELNWTFAIYYADAVGDLDEKDALYADLRKRYGWVSRTGQIIFDYFKTHRNDWVAHEKYFENYFALWSHFLKQGNLQRAEELWRSVLNNATYWERKFKSRIDKSFPYYCWAVTAIKAGNIDKGFLDCTKL